MAKGDLTIVLDERQYRDLMSRLEGLANVDKRKAIAGALKNGMQVIMNKGKANLRMTDLHTGKRGNLKSSFAIKLDRKKSISYAGFKRPKGAAAHLVDRGTTRRYTKKGAYRGTVQKKGAYTGSLFWTNAVASEGYKAAVTLVDTIYDEVQKIMSRKQK